VHEIYQHISRNEDGSAGRRWRVVLPTLCLGGTLSK